MKNLDYIELEKRMRPNSWSQHGFLGLTEFLQAVLDTDAQTLGNLGITHSKVANALENIVSNVLRQDAADPARSRERMTRFPNFDAPVVAPEFSLSNLPDTNIGYRVGKLHVFIRQWRGFQKCPWGCPADPQLGSIDFLILNRETGESFTGPGLIVHLIREHHFFEGKASPYRVAPEKVVRVLQLQQG